MDDKNKLKSLHPFDSWPPPRKKNNEKIPLSEKLPRNVSFRDPNKEQMETSDMAVYEAEIEQELNQDKDESTDKSQENSSQKQNINNSDNSNQQEHRK